MEANELRVGNYLKTIKFSSEHFTVRGIAADRALPLMLIDSDGYAFEWALSEALEIPLTEEWLLKFGFEKNYNPEFDHRIEYWEVNNFKLAVYSAKVSHLITKTEIIFVHQLQNLYFALTGNELKIS